MRQDTHNSGRSIEQTLKDCGAWYLLLRAHDHIWKDGDWEFSIRWQASHFLWTFSNQVAYIAGRA